MTREDIVNALYIASNLPKLSDFHVWYHPDAKITIDKLCLKAAEEFGHVEEFRKYMQEQADLLKGRMASLEAEHAYLQRRFNSNGAAVNMLHAAIAIIDAPRSMFEGEAATETRRPRETAYSKLFHDGLSAAKKRDGGASFRRMMAVSRDELESFVNLFVETHDWQGVPKTMQDAVYGREVAKSIYDRLNAASAMPSSVTAGAGAPPSPGAAPGAARTEPLFGVNSPAATADNSGDRPTGGAAEPARQAEQPGRIDRIDPVRTAALESVVRSLAALDTSPIADPDAVDALRLRARAVLAATGVKHDKP